MKGVEEESMPWEKTTVTEERIRFVLAYQREVAGKRKNMCELCEQFGIARKTGYKYLNRHEEEGWAGLKDRSRAPLSGPHWIEPWVRERILQVKEEYDEFGAKKILAELCRVDPERSWPSISAIHQILRRAGLVRTPNRRRRYPHPGTPPAYTASAPNQEWSVDFKGQFRTGDRRYCYPLVIADTFSRYMLGCESMLQLSFDKTWRAFERVFGEYGLPDAIRSDNGHPFASPSVRRLSRLSVRWIRLAIEPRLIEPGKPQQNARHERLNLTLKQRTCLHPASNAREQQKVFDRFRHRYNDRRPHESLNQRRPAELYTRSTREYPSRLPPIEYPPGIEPRRVNANGVIKWHRHELFLSEVLAGEPVGVQLVDEGLWLLLFGTLVLGYYSDRDDKLHTEKQA
ncbi:MAG: integrase core domain-containing protein [Fimbriimonadales bacterium]